VTLPEAVFDLDCAGHYLRRIKSVGFSIPCVVGLYTSVNCTATLLRSSIRMEARLFKGNDPRFRDFTGSLQTIVTSTGQDHGLFDANVRDDRYSPFEGAGAVSEWHLELPAEAPPIRPRLDHRRRHRPGVHGPRRR
jgi:hypothetical protein